jgi:hypothetical protein
MIGSKWKVLAEWNEMWFVYAKRIEYWLGAVHYGYKP